MPKDRRITRANKKLSGLQVGEQIIIIPDHALAGRCGKYLGRDGGLVVVEFENGNRCCAEIYQIRKLST